MSGRRPILQWCLEPACESGPDVAAYPVLLPPTLGEHVEQNVSLATSSGTRFLLRLVCATVLRRATVCAIVTGPAPRKHAPPQAVYPRRLMGVWGYYRATWSIPGRIFGAEASPRVAQAERRCAGLCSLTRGNLVARHADCARLVDQSGKKGWQKRHGSTPGSSRVTRAGWLGSGWRQPASPQRASLGSGGVALRASTPGTPEL